MNLFDVYPLQDVTITAAKGSWLTDDKGLQYLDLYGGHAVISVGHGHPHYVSKLKDQLDKIGFYSNAVRMPLQEALAAKLIRLSGKTGYQLFLCNSGAEANENALKLASFHNGRKKIVAFYKSFHGRTSLAVSVTDNAAIRASVNDFSEVSFLPFNDVTALKECFAHHGAEISSVIVEGIQGVGGIRIASDAFLQTIRTLCDQHGAVFIADSVQCGYGRSGKFFSHDYAGIQADIYTMAKGMGNGFPIGGLLIHPSIKPWKGMLGSTFGGNHLACAAATAVIDIIEAEQLLQQANDTGDYIMKALASVAGVEKIRGRGLMIGFDLPGKMTAVRNNLLNRHRIFTGEAKPDVIRLLPALNLQTQDADIFIEALKQELQ